MDKHLIWLKQIVLQLKVFITLIKKRELLFLYFGSKLYLPKNDDLTQKVISELEFIRDSKIITPIARIDSKNLYDYVFCSKGNIIRGVRKSQTDAYGILSINDFFKYYKKKSLTLNPEIYPDMYGGLVLFSNKKRNI